MERLLVYTILFLLFNGISEGLNPPGVFDDDLFESVVDAQQCQAQLELLAKHTLRWRFYDASGKLPSGILSGNLADFGDYYQCLGIDQIIDQMSIQGKYCTVTIPLDQDPIVIPDIPDWNITLPEIPDLNITLPPDLNITWPELPFVVDEETIENLRTFSKIQQMAYILAGVNRRNEETQDIAQRNILPMAIATTMGMTMAVCVPKVCSPSQAIDFVQEMVPTLNISYNELYCRLPGDKRFDAADIVAVSLLAVIFALLVASTTYDLWYIHVKRDSSSANPLLRSFSVFTNTRRFLTFKSAPGAIECIDGIRSISMLWVILGHTYFLTLFGFVHNLEYILGWMSSFESIWVISAPITVDTFFVMSGILVVYTVVGKISRPRFLRSLHLFYLNRLLRMFPLLAVVVLLQASLLNHVADGPFWTNVAYSVQHCRNYWWSALLHVQNYVNPIELCLGQTWYLSVDVQLYVISPIVLFWMFGSSMMTWIALAAFILLSLVSTSLYSFLFNFSAALMAPSRIHEFEDYMMTYYVNTLARAPPFFIGMAYGYLLHQWRGRKIRINKLYVAVLWITSFLMMAFCIFSIYPVTQPDHEDQLFDNFLNAYMRAIWGLALGWLILACQHGYGGPINWFLSLSMWKLPARLSYAMYLVHFPLMMVVNGTWLKTQYFSSGDSFYRFMSELGFTTIFAFILCIAVDAPFSTLQKLAMKGGKRREKPAENKRPSNVIAAENHHVIKTAL